MKFIGRILILLFMGPVTLFLGLLIIGLVSYILPAQQERQPVEWTFRAVQTDSKFFEIHLVATLDESWHILSQNAAPNSIAIPTKIHFPTNPVVKFIGKPSEQGEVVVESDSWRYYENEVIFIQPVKVKDTKTPIVVKGIIAYQLFTSEKYLPPTNIEFTVILKRDSELP